MRAHEFVTEEINPEVVEPDFYAETNVDLPGVGPLKFVAKNIKPRPYTPQFLVKVFLPNGQSIGYFRFLIMDYEEPTGFRFLSTFKKFKDPYVIGANVSVWNEFQRKGIARAVYQWIKSMGNDLRPSPTQTDAGRSMWRGFEKAPLEERKKRRKKSRWAFSGPGGWYGYYYGGSGESEAGGDGGGGESVAENNSSVPNVIFLNDKAAIVGQQHGKTLKLSDSDRQRIRTIADKHGAWYEGNGMDQEFTKDTIDQYQGSWDDDLLSGKIKGYPAPFLYVLFSNVEENDTIEKIGADSNSTIFDRILNTQPSTNYFPDRQFDADTLEKFLQSVSEGPYDFVKLSQAPATEENVAKFFKLGEQLMWPSNWEEYPNRAGRVAKSVNDLRDKFLASRKRGVYVAGSDHLKAVEQFLSQALLENFADGKVKGKSRPGRVKRSGASCAGSVTDLRARAKKYGGEKGKMYHWCANMKSGRKK